MEHVYIPRKGDQILFLDFYNNLKALDNKSLCNHYNNAVKLGIVGVHAQGISLLALRKVFIERFGKSPVQLEEGVLISLSGEIILIGESYTELKIV